MMNTAASIRALLDEEGHAVTLEELKELERESAEKKGLMKQSAALLMLVSLCSSVISLFACGDVVFDPDGPSLTVGGARAKKIPMTTEQSKILDDIFGDGDESAAPFIDLHRDTAREDIRALVSLLKGISRRKGLAPTLRQCASDIADTAESRLTELEGI